MVKFTIQRDGQLDGCRGRKVERLHRARHQRAARAARYAPAAAAAGAFPNPTLTVHLNFEYTQMNRTFSLLVAGALPHRLGVVGAAAAAPAARPPSQQPTEISTTISSGEAGAPPRFAVPDFIALSSDAETVGGRRRRSRGCCGTT